MGWAGTVCQIPAVNVLPMNAIYYEWVDRVEEDAMWIHVHFSTFNETLAFYSHTHFERITKHTIDLSFDCQPITHRRRLDEMDIINMAQVHGTSSMLLACQSCCLLHPSHNLPAPRQLNTSSLHMVSPTHLSSKRISMWVRVGWKNYHRRNNARVNHVLGS